jgi:F-box/leucine-rich repeat protein 2/20
MAQNSTKTFASLTGAAFVLLTSEEIAALSRVELERLTFRSRALTATIATYIKAAETATTTETAVMTTTITTTTNNTVKFDIQAEAEVLKLTPQELAALSTHDLEQLLLRSQAVMRRCPFKSGCSFCALPDEYVLDILLTWITIEDLAQFDKALLNHMDRRAHLSLLRDTEHRGVLSESESHAYYRFDSGVAVWLESRNVYMRGLCFYNNGNDVTIPTGFLARTGQQLLSLDISDQIKIDDTAMEQLAQIFPRLVEISLSYCSRISDTALASLVRHCPRIHTICLYETPIPDAGLAILAQGYPALKKVELGYLDITDAGVCRLAEGCPELEVASLDGLEITDAAILSLFRHCPQLCRLFLLFCHAVTGDEISRNSIGGGGRLMKTLRIRDNGLTDSGLGNIAACCPNLEDIYIFNCREVTDTGFAELLRRCPRLHTVNLSYTRATFVGLDGLGAGDRALKKLSSNNSAITDAALAKIVEAFVNLDHLDLCSCKSITNESLATLSRSSLKLRVLNLGDTAITEAGLSIIGDSFKDLKELFLFRVQLTDTGLGELAIACTSLEHISLDGTQLTEAGIASLVERCSRLRRVRFVSGLPFTEEALCRLCETYPAICFT